MKWGIFTWGLSLWGEPDIVEASGDIICSATVNGDIKYNTSKASGNINSSSTVVGNIDYTKSYGTGNISAKATVSGKAFKMIGTLTDAPTYIFYFEGKVYFQNGYEYKSYDGTNAITVDGYIPKIAVATPWSGGGTPLESVNNLTGKKRQTFNGDGSHTTFQIAETNVASIDKVYVNGVLKTVTTHYTVNLTTGVITFTAGNTPTTGLDNVEIYWTKGSGNRDNVVKNRKSIIWGGANDTRVFMYGIDNKLFFSGLADSLLSAEYFPENNFITVGSNQWDVTNLTKQYDRLIINKEEGSYYSVADFDVTNGINFPTYPLNDKIGCIAFGQGQMILNNPFTLTKQGVFNFIATNVRDEKNVQFMSQRVQQGLSELDLSQAVTCDFESMYEYWVVIGKKAFVYNYKIDVWYYFEMSETPKNFTIVNKELFMGTQDGKVSRWRDSILSDAGEIISSKWSTGYLSFDANFINKFCNFVWVGLQPQARSLCNVTWETDKGETDPENPYVISYNLFSYDNVTYGDFSYSLNDSPQPFRLKFKAKKFCYMKVIGENDSILDGMKILNVTIPVIYGGMSK